MRYLWGPATLFIHFNEIFKAQSFISGLNATYIPTKQNSYTYEKFIKILDTGAKASSSGRE
jgi:hypothetical protein